ncbi:conserved hypothetical protein [Rhodopseudomonas palustris HaA2]|uniref:Uncharacterized protein n=1 Tax=Rhodopseudomonas palustris (strain HaA2) TaxID=316058 RepID=Q2IWG8_RHOP2|nr:hypothetical protein [Rhodopseudomonas palustris]ABD07442.1 conserved hypothetical protein [Rhodopseudomonas palustris HaA2]
MTTTRISLIRRIALSLIVAASLPAASTASFAYSAEAAQMCTDDAFKLCASEIPSIPKITACMRSNRTKLSTGCRAVMDRDLAAAKSHKVAAE